ncbi:MAG: serine/threonine protein kinase [Myxococcota bacterium]|nr:serine/threonine protein kinase [Myxococcota bacterium]
MSDPAFGDEGDVAPLRTATRFGPYVLCYELASGGMGAVFLAKAEGPRGFEKLVALKRIHPHLARDPRFATMFLDEARIAARIHHPNVCGVHEFGEVEGVYYLTMPYLVGEPLHRVLREAASTTPALRDERPWMISRLVVDACEGLHAAHELRDEAGQLLEVVHRDVSPQNLLVGYDGSARVLDFGVASARHRHYRTSTGEVKGKFAYLAPEQLEGKTADRRVDVWALGVVLWEGLAGRRLFARENMAASVRAVSQDPIPPLSDFVDLPDEIQRVVDRALARDRDARYATAREMGRDLLHALARHRVVGPADVGEWLAMLFPNGRAAGERLVEESRVLSLDEVSGIALTSGGATGTMTVRDAELSTADDTHDPRAHDPHAPDPHAHDEASQTRARTRSRATTASARRRSDGPADPTEATPLVTPRARAAHARTRWIVAALVGALGLVAVAVVALSLRASPEPATTGTATPLASTPHTSARPSSTPAATPTAAPTATPTAAPTATPSTTSPPDGVASEPVRSTALVPTNAPDPNGTNAMGSAPVEPVDATSTSDDSSDTTARPGRLQVATPGGWALVFRGRARLGESPGTFALPAGAHEIGIQPFGEGPIRRRRVVIPSGGTTRLSIPIR